MKRGNKVLFVSVIVIAVILLIIFKIAAIYFEKGMFKNINEDMLKDLDKGGYDPSAGFDWGFSKCPFSCYYNLFSSTMITNHPVLDIFTTEGATAYRHSSVTAGNNIYINISALNIGKTAIPYANISIEDSDTFQSVSWFSNQWKLLNLPAMESIQNPDFMVFKLKDGLPLISPGKYNLKFRIICPICKEQVYYKYLPICVYETDPVQDCGGIWWHRQY